MIPPSVQIGAMGLSKAMQKLSIHINTEQRPSNLIMEQKIKRKRNGYIGLTFLAEVFWDSILEAASGKPLDPKNDDAITAKHNADTSAIVAACVGLELWPSK